MQITTNVSCNTGKLPHSNQAGNCFRVLSELRTPVQTKHKPAKSYFTYCLFISNVSQLSRNSISMAQAEYQILEQKGSLYSGAESDIEWDSKKTLRRKSLCIYILTILLAFSGAFSLWLSVTSDQRQYRCSSYRMASRSLFPFLQRLTLGHRCQ